MNMNDYKDVTNTGKPFKPTQWKNVKNRERTPYDWDWDDVEDRDIVNFIIQKAIDISPKTDGSKEQDYEIMKTFPWIAVRLTRRMQSTIWNQEKIINKQRDELIAVRKELSQAKRNKK